MQKAKILLITLAVSWLFLLYKGILHIWDIFLLCLARQTASPPSLEGMDSVLYPSAEMIQQARSILAENFLGQASLSTFFRELFLRPYGTLWIFCTLGILLCAGWGFVEIKKQEKKRQEACLIAIHQPDQEGPAQSREILEAVRNLEAGLYRQQEQIHQDYQLQMEFKENIFHQLKSDLGACLLSLDLMQMDPEGIEKQLANLENSLDSALGLCDQYLKSGELKNRETLYHFTYGSFHLILLQSLREAQLLYPEKEIVISGDCRVFLYMDPLWLKEAISSLLLNALEYSKDSAITVHCSIEETQQSLCIEISNPLSSSMETLSFHRYEGSRKPGHYGIGLHMVKSIIDAHQGSIRSSGQNDQACLEIRLPLLF